MINAYRPRTHKSLSGVEEARERLHIGRRQLIEAARSGYGDRFGSRSRLIDF